MLPWFGVCDMACAPCCSVILLLTCGVPSTVLASLCLATSLVTLGAIAVAVLPLDALASLLFRCVYVMLLGSMIVQVRLAFLLACY